MATNNVLVNNLCSWPLSFWRKAGQGDIEIPANARNYPLLSYEEVLAQIQTGNVMFVGIDGMGGHARIQIVNEEQRKQLFGLDGVDVPDPSVLNVESVKALLAIKTKGKFHEQLESMVKTNAEKKMLVELAFEAGADGGDRSPGRWTPCASWMFPSRRKWGSSALMTPPPAAISIPG